MSVVPPILEAVAALSEAAGRLRELGREESAHRCDTAAARLQLLIDEELEAIEAEDAGKS